MVGRHVPFLSKRAPCIFSGAALQKVEIGNKPKKLHKSPQLQGGKTMDEMDTNSLLLPASYGGPRPIAKQKQRLSLWVG